MQKKIQNFGSSPRYCSELRWSNQLIENTWVLPVPHWLLVLHIFNLIVLENTNRACLISSKFYKLLKHKTTETFALYHLPPIFYSIVCYAFFYYRAFFLNPLRRDYALGVVSELQVPPECSSLRTCMLLSFIEKSTTSLLRQRIQTKNRLFSFPKIQSPILWVDHFSIDKTKTVRELKVVLASTSYASRGTEKIYSLEKYLLGIYLIKLYAMILVKEVHVQFLQGNLSLGEVK